jgi:hypothetical protein
VHNSLTAIEEDNFYGKMPYQEPSPHRWEHKSKASDWDASLGPARARYTWQYLGAGYAAVWATENTREAIFDAMQRRETFGTSGTRIRLRLFGGWGFAPDFLASRDWPARAYAEGVPMGSDLPPAPGAAAPVFLVWALKAPDGAALDRAQIIKVWLDGETPREQIFDVPSRAGTGGAGEIIARWQDPAFDARQPAVYYLRVLEVETRRWTTLMAERFGLPRPQASAAMISERAWSSPIWYRGATARAAKRITDPAPSANTETEQHP